MDNEQAMANEFLLFIIIITFFGALFWLFLCDITNTFTLETVQPLANAGQISMQTRNAYDFGVNILKFWPVILLVSEILFSVVAGIYRRDQPTG